MYLSLCSDKEPVSILRVVLVDLLELPRHQIDHQFWREDTDQHLVTG